MDAAQVKSFLGFYRSGTLCTISVAHKGFPFGSLVEYDMDPAGRPLIFVSRLAEHFKNLSSDPRASLFVSDASGLRDPQAHARATLLCRFTPVADEERDEAATSYFSRFPTSKGRSLAHDFVFFRAEVERVRWIGGFGNIRWVSAADYVAAEFDPVSYRGPEAVEHMNDDHRDALRDLVLSCNEIQDLEHEISMTFLDRNGFTVSLRGPHGERRVTIPFAKPLTAYDEVRSALIDELKMARARLKTASPPAAEE